MPSNGNVPLWLDTLPWFFSIMKLFKGDSNTCGSKLIFLPRLHECPDLHKPSTGTQLAKLLIPKYIL